MKTLKSLVIPCMLVSAFAMMALVHHFMNQKPNGRSLWPHHPEWYYGPKPERLVEYLQSQHDGVPVEEIIESLEP